jgi:hypothetical protein
MVGTVITRPTRVVLVLLLVGVAHAALLGSVGRASDVRDVRGARGAVATVHVATAPIRVRMLPLPTAVVPARPRTLASQHSNTEPTALPAAASIELPEAPQTSAPATDDTRYLPATALDRTALPRSAPDTRLLDNVVLSGLPLRLRICIDAFGHVTQVLPLQVHPDDAAAVTALQEMFSATAYVPGRLGGADVASYIDLDISVGPGTAS